MVSQPTPGNIDTEQLPPVTGGIAAGLVLGLLGIIALVLPFLTGIALALLLGWLLIVGALIHVAAAFSADRVLGLVWKLVLGIVYAIAGLVVISNPILGLATLTFLIIAFLAVNGIVQLGWALFDGDGSRLWVGLSGVVSLVLAVLLWTGLPATGIWLVGVYFGVTLIFTGIAMIQQERSLKKTPLGETSPQTEGQEV